MASSSSAERRANEAMLLGGLGIIASTALIVLFGLHLARSIAGPVRTVAGGASRLAGRRAVVAAAGRRPGRGGRAHAFVQRDGGGAPRCRIMPYYKTSTTPATTTCCHAVRTRPRPSAAPAAAAPP